MTVTGSSTAVVYDRVSSDQMTVTPMSSMAVYDRVSSDQMSADEGAKLLMKRSRGDLPQKPAWMPGWIYVTVVVVVALLFAPIMSSGSDRNS
jgi:hypothetical protein